MTANDIRRILMLVAARDPSAPTELRKLAARINTIADGLESGQNGTKSTGGIGDRVRMQLVGPDGQVRHDTDPAMN